MTVPTPSFARWTMISSLLVWLAALTIASAERRHLQRNNNQHHYPRQGGNDVGHTKEAAALRAYNLRKKKRKGLLGKRQKSLAEVLFPGVTPELYKSDEQVFMMTDLVQSKKTVGASSFDSVWQLETSTSTLPAMDQRAFHSTHITLNLWVPCFLFPSSPARSL